MTPVKNQKVNPAHITFILAGFNQFMDYNIVGAAGIASRPPGRDFKPWQF
ncbi:hypothetical protein DCCM_3865 [Desulfocucumis palustris]|uniref:Uncharacterized protein n=1 Tax=Desulfocucumis palustris TaxID=1898651 RepID=A0A2L2XET3_9FIRM|nr:hypothetical protein DCCM_3865 [Desulfocucumis palustris]